jgi:hypothetical protein
VYGVGHLRYLRPMGLGDRCRHLDLDRCQECAGPLPRWRFWWPLSMSANRDSQFRLGCGQVVHSDEVVGLWIAQRCKCYYRK